jgi:cellulose synthase/poly-beta-1,6-N-acetylglucosamine synthase-like glycosyltransferase
VANLFYFLAVVQIFLGLYMIADGLRWLAYARRRTLRHPGFYSPRAAVICPCKGMELGLDRNLLSLCEFDYPDYAVFFVLASSDDPAHSLLRNVIERSKRPAHVVIAGPPEGCGEKVNNLRAAVEQLPPEFDVLVFADSDGRPDHLWLQHLVAPLADSRLGAASTFRWFFPLRANPAAALESAWNAPIVTMLGEHANNFCWGGGTAIRRSVFEQAGVLEEWRNSVSDDLSMTRALRRAGRQILFVPECLTPSYRQTDFATLLEFTDRQVILVRTYSPRHWFLGAAAHGLYCVTILLGLVAILDALVAGSLASHLVFLTFLPMVLAALRGAVRLIAVSEINPAWKRQLSEQGWIWTLLAPIVPFLYAINYLTSLFSRRIRWRGIRYKLVSPNQTRILSP